MGDSVALTVESNPSGETPVPAAGPVPGADAQMNDYSEAEMAAAAAALDAEAETRAQLEAARSQKLAEVTAKLAALQEHDNSVTVFCHVPMHILDEGPDAQSVRATLVKHLLQQSQIPLEQLVDVSVTSFRVAKAATAGMTADMDAADKAPTMYPMLGVVLRDQQTATAFVGARARTGVYTIMQANVGVELGSAVWVAYEHSLGEIKDLPHTLASAVGTVIRCYLPHVPAFLCTPRVRADAKEQLEMLLQIFWNTQDPVPLLQLRANLVPPDGNRIQGTSQFIPQGLYFDLDVTEAPALWPADLPTFGQCRWLIHDTLLVRKFDGHGPGEPQAKTRYGRRLSNYLAGIVPEGTNPDESVAMPKGRKRSAHDRKRKHAKESQSKKANKLEEGEIPEASRLRPPQNGEASSSTAQFYTYVQPR